MRQESRLERALLGRALLWQLELDFLGAPGSHWNMNQLPSGGRGCWVLIHSHRPW